MASRAVLLFAAVTMLFAVARGGTRFFYCPMTQQSFDASPCSAAHDEADDSDRATVRNADCCEQKWRAMAPPSSEPNVVQPSIARAALTALLPARLLDVSIASSKPPFGLAPFVRAGPPPPTAGERRAQLMVFHT